MSAQDRKLVVVEKGSSVDSTKILPGGAATPMTTSLSGGSGGSGEAQTPEPKIRDRTAESATKDSRRKRRKTAPKVDGTVFDCLKCGEPMLGNIFICSMGHPVCETCMQCLMGSNSRCPKSTCKGVYPARAIRHFALEAQVANCTFRCKHGCGTMATPAELARHMQTCDMRSVPCPVRGCDHKSAVKDMVQHLRSANHEKDVTIIKQIGEEPITTTLCCHIRQGFAPAEWQDYTTNRSWPKLLLLEGTHGLFYLADRRFENGFFLARACHFHAPCKYTLQFSDNDGDNTMTKSGSTCFAGADATDNIRIHGSMLEEFVQLASDETEHCPCKLALQVSVRSK